MFLDVYIDVHSGVAVEAALALIQIKNIQGFVLVALILGSKEQHENQSKKKIIIADRTLSFYLAEWSSSTMNSGIMDLLLGSKTRFTLYSR